MQDKVIDYDIALAAIPIICISVYYIDCLICIFQEVLFHRKIFFSNNDNLTKLLNLIYTNSKT